MFNHQLAGLGASVPDADIATFWAAHDLNPSALYAGANANGLTSADILHALLAYGFPATMTTAEIDEILTAGRIGFTDISAYGLALRIIAGQDALSNYANISPTSAAYAQIPTQAQIDALRALRGIAPPAPTATPTPAPTNSPTSVPGGVTDAQIYAFVTAHLNNPTAVFEWVTSNAVSVSRLANVMGEPFADTRAYLAAGSSGVTDWNAYKARNLTATAAPRNLAPTLPPVGFTAPGGGAPVGTDERVTTQPAVESKSLLKNPIVLGIGALAVYKILRG